MEISSKEDVNVDTAFLTMIKEIHSKHIGLSISNSNLIGSDNQMNSNSGYFKYNNKSNNNYNNNSSSVFKNNKEDNNLKSRCCGF